MQAIYSTYFCRLISKGVVKYFLSIWIIFLSCFLNLSALSDHNFAELSYNESPDQTQYSEYGLPQSDRTFISVPSSQHHFPELQIEATEIEVEENEVDGTSKGFATTGVFAQILLAAFLGLFLRDASLAQKFRRHFFFFTSYSSLFIKLRVIRI